MKRKGIAVDWVSSFGPARFFFNLVGLVKACCRILRMIDLAIWTCKVFFNLVGLVKVVAEYCG
ncbi:hypothetical protein DHD05_09460 [Arenibacter sp. N53]|nr:hypothetical protein [Arenibacter sp. N53]